MEVHPAACRELAVSPGLTSPNYQRPGFDPVIRSRSSISFTANDLITRSGRFWCTAVDGVSCALMERIHGVASAVARRFSISPVDAQSVVLELPPPSRTAALSGP